MFNNIWNALSGNIWPFTIAILNLWAIGKAIWFVRDYFYHRGGKRCQGLETVVCLAARLQHLFRIIIVPNTLQKKKSIDKSVQSLSTDFQLHSLNNHVGNTITLHGIEMKLRLNKISSTTLGSGKGSVR